MRNIAFENIASIGASYSINNVTVSVYGAEGESNTTVYMSGPWPGVNGGIRDLCQLEAPVEEDGVEHTFNHSATQPWPVGGLSRVIVTFDARDASGNVLQSWQMPRGGASPLPADVPFYAQLVFTPPNGTRRLLFRTAMECNSGYTALDSNNIWAASGFTLLTPSSPTVAPPGRLTPRDDRGRLYPRPTSRQQSARLVGGYY